MSQMSPEYKAAWHQARKSKPKLTILEKKCSGCEKVLPVSQFHKYQASKDGYVSKCKGCSSQRVAIYYQENKSFVIGQVRVYEKKRVVEDICFRLAKNLRSRLGSALRGNFKSGSAVRDLGCSIEELKTHLEEKFYPCPETGKLMSWDNYGEWHIDHIDPLSAFDLEDREQFLKASYYTNLQPLWSKENLQKGGSR